jgi:hypothetical protein
VDGERARERSFSAKAIAVASVDYVQGGAFGLLLWIAWGWPVMWGGVLGRGEEKDMDWQRADAASVNDR